MNSIAGVLPVGFSKNRKSEIGIPVARKKNRKTEIGIPVPKMAGNRKSENGNRKSAAPLLYR